jgi:dolichol kinase
VSARDILSLRAEVARKALHALTALLPVSLAWGWVDQRSLRIILAAAALLALTVEALRAMWPAFATAFTQLFGPLIRGHERRALTGATWLAIAMAAVLWLAPLHAAIAALWAAAVGDAAAAVVGRAVRHAQQRDASGKTFVGSLAAALATAGGVLWLTPATLPIASVLGVVAAAAERPSIGLDDNLRIALAVALAATLLGLR